jgi:hypothetical protein
MDVDHGLNVGVGAVDAGVHLDLVTLADALRPFNFAALEVATIVPRRISRRRHVVAPAFNNKMAPLDALLA